MRMPFSNPLPIFSDYDSDTQSLLPFYSSAVTVPQFTQPATAFRSSIYRTAALIFSFLAILTPCDLDMYVLVDVFC
jgi:hypothetical protein